MILRGLVIAMERAIRDNLVLTVCVGSVYKTSWVALNRVLNGTGSAPHTLWMGDSVDLFNEDSQSPDCMLSPNTDSFSAYLAG
jgi:hypothetical protein